MTPALQELLDAQVATGDPGGAACVVRRGEVVAEAVAGTRDGTVPWDVDTLVMTFSCAKPLAALTLLTAVADGALGLDQRVVELWPEYDAHGKQDTTVRHVLSHQAGVPWWGPEADGVAFDDRDALVALLAAATPVHPPGQACAEHAKTYGHLLDELLRRATGEDLADRFAGLAAAHGWDLHLRVAEADLGRCADVVVLGDWAARYADTDRHGPDRARPAATVDPAVLNTARWRRTSFPAISLHASARGLATFYDDLTSGVVADLLGPALHAEYVGPQVSGHDLLLDQDVTWTLGFLRDEVDLGMGGAGGCSAWWSFGGAYAAAYVSRGLGDHDRAEAVWELVEPTPT